MVNGHAVDVYAIELQMLLFELCTQWIVDGFAIGTKWIEGHSIRYINFGRCFYLRVACLPPHQKNCANSMLVV